MQHTTRIRFLSTVFTISISLGSVAVWAESDWRSDLYAEDWSPPGLGKNFYTDKIIQDFSYAGYRLGQKPIPDIVAPSRRTELFDVTTAPYHADPTGATDSTAAIQQAINDAGQALSAVVYLPAGTYRVSAGPSNDVLRIDQSDIVLRGAGIDQTFLLNTTYDRRQQRIIGVEGPGRNWRIDQNPTVPITEDLMGPTRFIPVANTTSVSLGDWIMIRTDTTVEWVDEHHEPGWRDHAGSGSLNGLAYYRQVVGIDEETGTLIIDIPTRYALKTRDSARIHPAGDQITEVGLEDFSIGNLEHPGTDDNQWSPGSYSNPNHHAYEVHGVAAIYFVHARDSWVRNVHSFRPSANIRNTHHLSNGVVINSSRSLTLENVHMQRPLYGGGGGNGYMFRLSNSSDVLFKQCLASHSRHGFVFASMSTAGNVIHDSEDRHTNWQAAGNNHAGGSNSDHHMFFSHSNLVDQSRVRESMFEARYRPYTDPPQHNITAAHSAFWNTMGLGGGSNAVHSDQARYGYVIGTQGLEGSSRYGVVLGDGSRQQTLPEDHVEGVGHGATLYPASLYLDQLERRQSSIQLDVIQRSHAVLPSNTAQLRAYVTLGNSLGIDQEDIDYQWSLVDGPGPVEFSSPDQLATGVFLHHPGKHHIRLTATAGESHGDLKTYVEFSPFPASSTEVLTNQFLPTDDTHVQSSAADSNFGDNATIRAKVLGNLNERQAFLRFDMSDRPISPGDLISATLHLEKTNESISHTGALFQGTDTDWNENSVTYNNMPTAETSVVTWEGSGDPGPLELDVTGAVQAALGVDGLLSLRLAILNQASVAPLMEYASKEHGNPDFRPRLTIEFPSVQSYDQWVADQDLPPDERAATHDRFGRGISNLVSYLTGISAADPQSPLMQQSFVGDSVRFLIPWRTDLAEAPFFLVYESSDLTDWVLAREVDWTESPIPGDRTLFEGEAPLDSEEHFRRFYRLQFFLNQ